MISLVIFLLALTQAQENPQDHYCGLSWPHAFETCSLPCPTQEDAECSSLGADYACFGYTGCRDKESTNNGGEIVEEETTDVQTTEGDSQGEVVEENMYCGTTWAQAEENCNEQCTSPSSCPTGQTCYMATNCYNPIISLKSNMLVTMQGPDRAMETSEGDVFGGTMNDIIGEQATALGVNMGGVEVGAQEILDRRTLYDRIGERYLSTRIYNITQRFLPSGSSALDVSMVVTGEYRPPPYLDLDVIAEDSINRAGTKVVSTLKERGSRAGMTFFDRVSGVEAVARVIVTQRPTKTPTAKPTRGPSRSPTSAPSMEPSSSPSDMPSSEPTRIVYNTIMTGSHEDLLLGGTTTSSYGFLFNMRSKPEASVSLITGLDFYTHSTELVTVSLWSRQGKFQDFKTSLDGWDLIAQGDVQGRGVGRYTTIPEEMFTPVEIRGGGGDYGTRAFYITLSTIDLVYQISEGTAADMAVQVDTPDLEVWEGEGVLAQDLPPADDPVAYIFFRYPRRFLGTIYYDRVPCKPFKAYGEIDELPCPILPTQSPSLPQPSMSPVTSPPTRRPVSQAPVTPAPYWGTPAPIAPTETPTLPPTSSRPPSFAPSTSYPSGSPIVPMRVNLNVNLRNVPERPMTEREYEKFIELMMKFLNKHIESNMAIDGIEIWHQQLVFVDAAVDTTLENEMPISQQKRLKPRELLEQEKKDQIIAFKQKQKEEAVPQTSAMQVTLIIKVSFSFLPQDLLAKLAVVTIEENVMDLVMMLQEQSAFYTYFKPLDGITSEVVTELTPPPTPSPTTLAFYLANQQEDVVLEEESGFGFGALIGLGVGFLWCCLTGCSIVYVMKARSAMREQRDLENLLKQEKSTPIDESETSSDKSSIPMGNEDNIDEVSLSTEAELSILERKKMGLTSSKQNMPNLEVLAEINEDEVSLSTEAELSILEKKKMGLTSSKQNMLPPEVLAEIKEDEVSLSTAAELSILEAKKMELASSRQNIPKLTSPDSKHLSSSLRHSTESQRTLNSSIKKSIRREGLKVSSRKQLTNSMKKSIRRDGSSDSSRGSTKARDDVSSSVRSSTKARDDISNSLKSSTKARNDASSSVRSSMKERDRRGPTERKVYSKSVSDASASFQKGTHRVSSQNHLRSDSSRTSTKEKERRGPAERKTFSKSVSVGSDSYDHEGMHRGRLQTDVYNVTGSVKR